MIQLYTAGTPNGKKISIYLEEAALPYKVHRVDLGKQDQFKPDFLAISPNNKIPAIIDQDGPGGAALPVFESGAILIYLGEKTGKLLPQEPRARSQAVQWLMFQMGGIGPMFGQNYHFQKAAPEKLPYAITRYVDETRRLFGVMDRRLAEAPYLAGDYSVADIAAFPWVTGDWHGVSRAEFPNLSRWHDAIAARPAVQRGMQIPN
jgi:GSH-dependent disulfide-bond oxidoreductase